MSEGKKNWLARLRSGLGRSASRLADGVSAILTRRALDQEALDALEELLISADLGPATAAELVETLRRHRFEGEIDDKAVKTVLAAEIEAILAPSAKPLSFDAQRKPTVILIVGVNGSGKTTTIGKLAQYYAEQGKKTVIAAGDTFRAAAIEQLKIWSDRSGAVLVARDPGSDPAGLAFDALQRAQEDQADLLIIDTAGRLHNKTDLMAELQKIIRVIRKRDPSAPHHCLLVLDATTGQNAHAQLETFKNLVDVNGLIVTKLDGSARGGVIVALAKKHHLPIHAIGVGEGADDLRPFSAQAFALSLMGLSINQSDDA